MKFVWKGKLTPETMVIYPNLPANAKVLVNEKSAWIMYSLVLPLLALAYLAIRLRRGSFDGMLFTRPALFAGVGLALIFLPVHELIHAVCCPARSTIFVYLTSGGLCLVPTCKLKKLRYITMALMPALVLGVVPLALWLLLPHMTAVVSSVLFAFSIGSLSMSIGDVYNAVLAACKMPADAVLVTSGMDCYFF